MTAAVEPLEQWRGAAYRLGRRWHRAGREWPASPDALWTEIARACARATGHEPRERLAAVEDAWYKGYDSTTRSAGRQKRSALPVAVVSVALDQRELGEIDAARGETPRSTWIREAAIAVARADLRDKR